METDLQTQIDKLAQKIHELSLIPAARAFTAIFMTFDIVDNYVRVQLRDDEISRAGKTILHILIKNGGSMTATEISRHAWRSKFATIRVIDTLEREGYVTRRQPETSGDRRKKVITITTSGVALFKKTLDKSLKVLCYQVLEGLTEEQIKQCYQTLEHIGKCTSMLMKPLKASFADRTPAEPPDPAPPVIPLQEHRHQRSTANGE